jgi:hypothetical protein
MTAQRLARRALRIAQRYVLPAPARNCERVSRAWNEGLWPLRSTVLPKWLR